MLSTGLRSLHFSRTSDKTPDLEVRLKLANIAVASRKAASEGSMTVTLLSTSGRWIVDANGRRVKLAGVNWPGAHEDDMVPSGLDYQDRNEITEWGFNSVRLTFAVRTLTVTGQANPGLLAANPDLVGHTPWGVFQAVVQALTGQGLIVIPDCHMLFGGLVLLRRRQQRPVVQRQLAGEPFPGGMADHRNRVRGQPARCRLRHQERAEERDDRRRSTHADVG